MVCNVKKTERMVRVALGLGIIAVGVAMKSWWGAIGLVPIFTGSVGYCPLYSVCPISMGDHFGAKK